MTEQRAWAGPLFIVGASRSGTAMMRSILNNHSAVKLAGETHHFDDLRVRRKMRQNGALSDADAATCADYFRALDDRPYGLKGDPSRSRLSREDLIRRARSLGGGPDAFFEAYCRAVAERDGKGIWGEKTPRHVFRLHEILTCYPGAKAICMVRDPRAVVASYRDWRNRGGLNQDGDRGYAMAIAAEEKRARLSYNIVIATLLWRGTVRSAARAQAEFGADRVRLVRYEDVVSDPKGAIEAVCRWLGLAFEADMLHVPMHNSSFNTFNWNAGVTDASIGQWRTKLSAHEIGVVQRVAGGALRRAGYEGDDVQAGGAGLLAECLRMPAAVARAGLANRKRMGNVFAYTWRRVRAVVLH